MNMEIRKMTKALFLDGPLAGQWKEVDEKILNGDAYVCPGGIYFLYAYPRKDEVYYFLSVKDEEEIDIFALVIEILKER